VTNLLCSGETTLQQIYPLDVDGLQDSTSGAVTDKYDSVDPPVPKQTSYTCGSTVVAVDPYRSSLVYPGISPFLDQSHWLNISGSVLSHALLIENIRLLVMQWSTQFFTKQMNIERAPVKSQSISTTLNGMKSGKKEVHFESPDTDVPKYCFTLHRKDAGFKGESIPKSVHPPLSDYEVDTVLDAHMFTVRRRLREGNMNEKWLRIRKTLCGDRAFLRTLCSACQEDPYWSYLHGIAISSEGDVVLSIDTIVKNAFDASFNACDFSPSHLSPHEGSPVGALTTRLGSASELVRSPRIDASTARRKSITGNNVQSSRSRRSSVVTTQRSDEMQSASPINVGSASPVNNDSKDEPEDPLAAQDREMMISLQLVSLVSDVLCNHRGLCANAVQAAFAYTAAANHCLCRKYEEESDLFVGNCVDDEDQEDATETGRSETQTLSHSDSKTVALPHLHSALVITIDNEGEHAAKPRDGDHHGHGHNHPLNSQKAAHEEPHQGKADDVSDAKQDDKQGVDEEDHGASEEEYHDGMEYIFADDVEDSENDDNNDKSTSVPIVITAVDIARHIFSQHDPRPITTQPRNASTSFSVPQAAVATNGYAPLYNNAPLPADTKSQTGTLSAKDSQSRLVHFSQKAATPAPTPLLNDPDTEDSISMRSTIETITDPAHLAQLRAHRVYPHCTVPVHKRSGVEKLKALVDGAVVTRTIAVQLSSIATSSVPGNTGSTSSAMIKVRIGGIPKHYCGCDVTLALSPCSIPFSHILLAQHYVQVHAERLYPIARTLGEISVDFHVLHELYWLSLSPVQQNALLIAHLQKISVKHHQRVSMFENGVPFFSPPMYDQDLTQAKVIPRTAEAGVQTEYTYADFTVQTPVWLMFNFDANEVERAQRHEELTTKSRARQLL